MKLVLLLAAAVILIRDPTGKWTRDPLQPWFESLRNKVGQYCCAKADGRRLDEGEWDIKDNHYRVLLQGKWTVVPDDTLLLGPNRFGKAIVWLESPGEPWGGNTSIPILCFMPFVAQHVTKNIKVDWVFHYSNQVTRKKFKEKFFQAISKIH